jgi:hypothetical protein
MARNQIAIKIAMRKDESVKSPGYGTFKLEAHVAKDQAPTTLENGIDLNSVVDGLKLVVIPDNTELDKLTSKANKAKASMELAGVIVREPNGKQDKQGNALMASVVKPLNVYLAAQNPGNGG